MAAKVLQTKEILFSDEDQGAGLDGGEPGLDIVVRDAAVLEEQIKQENVNANAAQPGQK